VLLYTCGTEKAAKEEKINKKKHHTLSGGNEND